jgi:hypothetical protein
MGVPIAVVRIRPSDFALEWMQAVADLLEAVENDEPPEMIRDRAAYVRHVLWGAKAAEG